ncbi:MAG TPA: VWA domain-containing protein [Pyrinomonadaceae bacterium]|nr:VWA domain-containing protein [Pyrinomonadaceae bacterium]
MKKAFVVVLLISLLVASAAPLSAQLRSRRVGNPPPGTTQTPTPAPRNPPANQKPGTPSTSSEPIAEEVGEDDVVRVNTALVTIPVSIMDRDGRYIPNLSKDDFRIFEDNTEQDVAYFAAVEQPFTVALLLDTSGSTEFKIEEIQDAAIAFVDQLRPEDSVMVIAFDDQIDVLTEATNDRRQLRNAIRRARSGGGTRLYDAVDFTIKQRLNRIKGRKAIVLFTDGVDTTSRTASYETNVRDAEELDAIVYPVQYDTYNGQHQGTGWPPTSRNPSIIFPFPLPFPMPIPGGRRGGGGGRGTSRGDYARAGAYLRDMAEKTGGRVHEAYDVSYLERAFESIAEELRRQYSLGYYPKVQSSIAARRQIKVRVKRPNLVVRARDSYIYKPAGDNATGTTAQDKQGRTSPEFRRSPFAGRNERVNEVFERR